ncbi:MAG: hypothetical protein MJZ67_08030 [Bacteroidales bacterium]|nr:hypothetical protein [Bacteroidales bacterium]
MKRLLLILSICLFVVLVHNELYAQHQTFLGINLGGNSELFKYELKQKGFYESRKEGYDCLYGQFLGVNCRLWILENEYNVEKVTLNYRYDEKHSYEKAKSMVLGLTQIICKELQKENEKYFLEEGVWIVGYYKSTFIYLKNGYYEVSAVCLDDDWIVSVSVVDSPNYILFNMHLQQEKSSSNKKNSR